MTVPHFTVRICQSCKSLYVWPVNTARPGRLCPRCMPLTGDEQLVLGAS